MYTAAALHGRTVFYVLLDSPDYIYELDVRKVLLLRERLDKADWCPKCKRKDQKGPFLISLEGCALYVECCDDLCTGKWFSAIQSSLSTSPSVVEDYRLTADNIPIIVDKCLRFVAAYGIRSEGIYRRNGKISEAKDIYRKLTEGKRFFVRIISCFGIFDFFISICFFAEYSSHSFSNELLLVHGITRACYILHVGRFSTIIPLYIHCLLFPPQKGLC
ncbi:hypothetical protein OESDEN_05894 [Oesophagostomum dentatum]|uniref:Rho-GAP domain-containing protein n=1 Tax=Oesophagostomum dentatum TaxID=61180 RepID=A0A0B1TEF7_OESDE|nr:hypothetical protein OESDEN_05894 [Oesophagostomum dentatum]